VKILVVAPYPPRHDAVHGGSRWLAGLVAAVAQTHRVALLALRATDESSVDEQVRGTCELVVEIPRRTLLDTSLTAWRERQRIRLTRERAPARAVAQSVRALETAIPATIADWRPDLVHVETAAMALYARRADATPVVVVDQDVDENDSRMQRFRLRTMAEVGAVVALTEHDRDLLSALLPHTRIEHIPLTVDVPPIPLDPVGNGRDVLFVGNYVHPPNIEAAERLVRAIFPRVLERRPDARLALVGPNLPARLRAALPTGVVAPGEVPDVAPWLAAAAVVIAPLASGGGMRVKTLEALAAGKALVASPRALAGIDVRAGEHALVADEDVAFAEAIAALLDDETRRASVARAARAWAESNLGWTHVRAAYDALYRSLV